ncbi:hypothetical protein KY310_02290 [Candidatus Woesearchaeota archaeon]|nr:hypothetical protein [Candidatus Woesearchaeota archaeon]
MNRQELLARKREVHNIFKNRSLLNSNPAQMQEDLQRFDKGLCLLLKGGTYRECCAMMEGFSTVYGWIKRGILPLSFRQSATRTKEIHPARLRNRKQFAYLLGVYQSKVEEIHPERLTISTRDQGLEKTVKQSLNSLRLKYSQATVSYANRRAERIYYDSKSLMSLISESTEDNTSIPKEFMQDQNLLISYLRGFFDSRATPSYMPRTTQKSRILRVQPRVVITKSGNTPLLSAINTALHLLGINSRYNARKTPDQIVIHEIESIKRLLDYPLFRNREKMQELKETYSHWKTYKRKR